MSITAFSELCEFIQGIIGTEGGFEKSLNLKLVSELGWTVDAEIHTILKYTKLFHCPISVFALPPAPSSLFTDGILFKLKDILH